MELLWTIGHIYFSTSQSMRQFTNHYKDQLEKYEYHMVISIDLWKIWTPHHTQSQGLSLDTRWTELTRFDRVQDTHCADADDFFGEWCHALRPFHRDRTTVNFIYEAYWRNFDRMSAHVLNNDVHRFKAILYQDRPFARIHHKSPYFHFEDVKVLETAMRNALAGSALPSHHDVAFMEEYGCTGLRVSITIAP